MHNFKNGSDVRFVIVEKLRSMVISCFKLHHHRHPHSSPFQEKSVSFQQTTARKKWWKAKERRGKFYRFSPKNNRMKFLPRSVSQVWWMVCVKALENDKFRRENPFHQQQSVQLITIWIGWLGTFNRMWWLESDFLIKLRFVHCSKRWKLHSKATMDNWPKHSQTLISLRFTEKTKLSNPISSFS